MRSEKGGNKGEGGGARVPGHRSRCGRGGRGGARGTTDVGDYFSHDFVQFVMGGCLNLIFYGCISALCKLLLCYRLYSNIVNIGDNVSDDFHC